MSVSENLLKNYYNFEVKSVIGVLVWKISKNI